MMRAVARPGMIAVLLIAAAPVGQGMPETRWQRISTDGGMVIGHATRVVSLRDGGGREIVTTREITLTEAEHGVVRQSELGVVHEDADGRTVSTTETVRGHDGWLRLTARIDGDAAVVLRETRGGRRSLRVALPPGVRFDGGAGLLPEWDPARTPVLRFADFDLGAMAVEQVTIERIADDATDPRTAITALRKRFDGAQLRSVTRLSIDRDGRIVTIRQPMFGTTITTADTDRAIALAPHAALPVRLDLSIKSPFRIPAAALGGHIRYQLGFRDGIAFAPPETAEQRVSVGADGVTIDICATCGPGLADDAQSLADARRATPWIESDARAIIAIAAPVARMDISDTRKMALLAIRARARLPRTDFTGHVSALEAIRRGAGDCTEDAVVLAALGRAAGIPTRVANGLVYSRQRYHGIGNAFMPHSWTLAYVDGAWRSFDMSLGAFDASHIALTIGDGDARAVTAAGQLASLLRWDAMVEVRER